MDPALLGASVAAVPALTALLTVAGIGRARKRKRAREAMRALDLPGTRRDMAMIIAMGGDPLTHRINPVTQPFKGLRLVDAKGEVVRSMTYRQLRKPEFLKRWERAERQMLVQAEAP